MAGGDRDGGQDGPAGEMQPELMRGVAKGVVNKNTASRKMSRLSRRVAALG